MWIYTFLLYRINLCQRKTSNSLLKVTASCSSGIQKSMYMLQIKPEMKSLCVWFRSDLNGIISLFFLSCHALMHIDNCMFLGFPSFFQVALVQAYLCLYGVRPFKKILWPLFLESKNILFLSWNNLILNLLTDTFLSILSHHSSSLIINNEKKKCNDFIILNICRIHDGSKQYKHIKKWENHSQEISHHVWTELELMSKIWTCQKP